MGRNTFVECGRDCELSYPEYGFRAMVSVIPRKWPLLSTPESTSEDPEQCNTQKFRHPDCIKIKTPKPIYSGDRFIPCRYNHNFDMAHHLLMKEDTMEETHIIDVCKQVDSLDTTYRRKALHAMMVEQSTIPGLNQNRILRFSSSMERRSRDPPCPKYEKNSWKCTPRKKALLGSVEKMLSMPDDYSVSSDDNNVIDWSCNGMMAVPKSTCMNIYDVNGDKVSSFEASSGSVSEITDVKWASDGNKLIMSITTPSNHFTESMLLMYDLKEQKILWKVSCECPTSQQGCIMRCICWSAHDLQIVTGCSGKISIFDSNTGRLVHSKYQHRNFRDELLTLSFSPDFKYLLSTAEDKYVRVFSWSKLTPCFNIKFREPVKAVAWHPQVPDLFCIGSSMNGSLSLWNVNKRAKTAFVRPKFNGRVENLAWNKLSGELVVHWIYKEGNDEYTIVAVLANLNEIVDVLPLDKKSQLRFLKFNAAHEQLITFCNTNNWNAVGHVSTWNFFGNKISSEKRHSRIQRREGVLVHNPIR